MVFCVTVHFWCQKPLKWDRCSEKNKNVIWSWNFQDPHISSIPATTQNKKKIEGGAQCKLVKLRWNGPCAFGPVPRSWPWVRSMYNRLYSRHGHFRTKTRLWCQVGLNRFMFLSTDPISDVEFKYQPISDSNPIWYIQSVKVLLIKIYLINDNFIETELIQIQ